MTKKVLSNEEVERLQVLRWRARTDLGFLCREILGYQDVDDYVHGPIIHMLQKFPKPKTYEQLREHDKWDGRKWNYVPLFNHLQDLPGGRRRLILDPRSHLKCLTENNLVLLSDGTYVSPKELSVGDLITGQSSENSFIPSKTLVTGIEVQEAQDCYRITFKSGRRLELSHQHPLRLISGWKKTEDIVVGDRIASHGKTPEPMDSRYYKQAALLGWFLGDGSFPGMNITNSDPFFLQKIKEAVSLAGFECTIRPPYGDRTTSTALIRGARPWVRSLGLANARSGDKFIPEIIFRSNNKSIREFIYGLFMSDGTANHAGISLTSKSERLCRGTQRLLRRLGIWSTVGSHYVNYNGDRLLFWQVRISTRKQVANFVKEIGWDKTFKFDLLKSDNSCSVPGSVPKAWRARFGKYIFGRGNKPSDLSRKTEFIKYDISKEKLKPFAVAAADKELEYLCGDDIYWDVVSKIEFIGKQKTYAVETATKTLCVDDIVTHNTTVNAQAHTIQWIINYPSIRIAIFQSSGPKAEAILREIKNHFRYNERFRQLFPEFCPQKQNEIDNFGTLDAFVTPARPKSDVAREPTVLALSIDKGTAGLHFHVIKYSDIVEPENVKNEERIKKVNDAFYVSESLLVTPGYWMDVEGTRYHEMDLYGELIDHWKEEKKEGKPRYQVHVRSCYKRADPSTGKEQDIFTPDTLDWPFIQVTRHRKGKDVKEYDPWWKTDASGRDRFTFDQLEAERRQDPYIFSCQKLLTPLGAPEGQEIFNINEMQRISLKNFRANVRIAHYTVTIDTAETVGYRSNYSVIVVAGWDAVHRCYIREIIRKKMLPAELVDKIFEVNKRYRPVSIKIEETGFVRGLEAAIAQKMQITGDYLPIEFVKRDNKIAKEERIQNSLQPYYKQKLIRFVEPFIDEKDPQNKDVEGWNAWDALCSELKTFPISKTDDILDALADQFIGKDFFGRMISRPAGPEQAYAAETLKYFGLEDPFEEEV